MFYFTNNFFTKPLIYREDDNQSSEQPTVNAANSPAVVQNTMSDNLSATRVLCGALIMPTVSSIVGRLFFDSIQNNFQRVLVGGFAFVAVKGALKIYFKQKQFTRKQKRIIVDYTTENIRRFGHREPQQTQRTANERQ